MMKRISINILTRVERAGNKLPDPSMLFFLLCLIVLGLSWVLSLFNVQATQPTNNKTIHVVNLLNWEGLTKILTETINNFVTFPALGMVLVVMIGMGLAEKTGYFEHLLHSVVDKTPHKLVLPFLILISILGNAAGGAAPMIMPMLTAMIFIKLGYHPISGLIMSYAAVEVGYGANLIIGLDDALSFSFTQSALKLFEGDISINIAMNWFFMSISTFLLVPIIYILAKKVTIPRFQNLSIDKDTDVSVDKKTFTKQEGKALLWSNWMLVLWLVCIVVIAIPKHSFLRNNETGQLLVDSPLMNGFGVILLITFAIPGIIYGIKSGKIQNSKSLGKILTQSMSDMSSFIIVIFFAAQLLAFFDWSHIGQVIAINGAKLLQHQSGVTLIIGLILLTATINIFMGSASAKWGILAPIFIPMFATLGFHPAFTQMVYRIGDSITNPITPMIPYLPFLLTVARKYNKKIALGTLIANLLPYSIIGGLIWTIFMIIWYSLGRPVGPGGPIHLGD
ncbi:AbgT family transporter [Staphylococcus sp. GDY8P120P]|uniref:AbgT family transporter n=1 Tax=Staphylococcus sp. GDY8P120P TaxID=2804156 RepID=UPI001AEC254D|nr:AbgT family transporter [Staphylococcus sp. GDY8P120P]